MLATKVLDEGWSFTQLGGGDVVKEGEWLAVKSFPTTVHVELLKYGRIPDPVRLRFLFILRCDCIDESAVHWVE